MTHTEPRTPAPAAPQPWPVMTAPSHWRQIDFISDLHLQASEPATFAAWQHTLHNTSADALFILGDLFEVWVGDDVAADLNASSFEAQCARVLQATTQRLPVYFMHGNRDFLLGPAFARTCGMTLLADPTVLCLGDERWLLSHGDALCLDDTDYLQFRAQVRSAAWQQTFLDQPLAQRQTIARALRAQSESRKHSGVAYADVDAQAARDWLHTAQAGTLIHGHTHRPADHALGQGLRRIVLSDWDAAAQPPRQQMLSLRRLDGDTGLSAASAWHISRD
jgi:UDP-2,3-diacylglucosamine hydrolase